MAINMGITLGPFNENLKVNYIWLLQIQKKKKTVKSKLLLVFGWNKLL